MQLYEIKDIAGCHFRVPVSAIEITPLWFWDDWITAWFYARQDN